MIIFADTHIKICLHRTITTILAEIIDIFEVQDRNRKLEKSTMEVFKMLFVSPYFGILV